MTCDVCQGRKFVRLPTYAELKVIEGDGGRDDFALPSTMEPDWKEFPCPQCVPMVPYRRVRAMKVTTAYPADVFGKMQMPIERGLAARFGEYLMREGLIRFTTAGSADLGRMKDQITVTAHLGVVSREDVKKSGAVEEVAMTAAPPIPRKLTRQERERVGVRVSPQAVAWEPKPGPWTDDPVTDEFDEPKDAIANRFSGLELDP